jgi:hypothetical protein
MSFAPEACFVENALRSHVVRYNERLDTSKSRAGHRPPSEESDCTRAEAATPNTGNEPVADLCRECEALGNINLLFRRQPDPASAIASDSPSRLSARPH